MDVLEGLFYHLVLNGNHIENKIKLLQKLR